MRRATRGPATPSYWAPGEGLVSDLRVLEPAATTEKAASLAAVRPLATTQERDRSPSEHAASGRHTVCAKQLAEGAMKNE